MSQDQREEVKEGQAKISHNRVFSQNLMNDFSGAQAIANEEANEIFARLLSQNSKRYPSLSYTALKEVYY